MKKLYYYADGQILSQRMHDPDDPNSYTPYFYVHDRLGRVRMVVDNTGVAVCSYTYRPYGVFYDGECVEAAGVDNPWKFTGQWYDAEIEQYYLRARQYDPKMMRFTSRDSVEGQFNEPLTLHKYLYCANGPISRIDWNGRSWGSVTDICGSMLIGSMVYGSIGGLSGVAWGGLSALYAVVFGGEKYDEDVFLDRMLWGGLKGAIYGAALGALAGGLGMTAACSE